MESVLTFLLVAMFLTAAIGTPIMWALAFAVMVTGTVQDMKPRRR